MKIDDYHHADCVRFRIPNIDFSSVNDALTLALVQACQNGNDPTTAIEKILNDRKLVGTLVDQVAETLKFQESAQMRVVESQNEDAVKKYDFERREQIQGVEDTLGKSAEEKKSMLHVVGKTAQEKSQAYSLAQSRLNELRSRVQSNLDELGGEVGYNSLQSLRKEFSVPLYDSHSVSKKPYPYSGMGWEEARKKEQEDLRAKAQGTYVQPLTLKEGFSEFQNHEGSSYSGTVVQKDRKKENNIFGQNSSLEERLQKDPRENVLRDPAKENAGKNAEKIGEEKQTALVKSEKGFWKKVWGVFNYKLW